METFTATLTILGTAQDGGIPQAGCGCQNCSAAFENPEKSRFPVSLGVRDNSGGMHLIEVSRALPEQLNIWANACGLEKPVRPDSVLLTHAHLGHIEGIGQFGKEAMGCTDITLVSSDSVASILTTRNLMQPFSKVESDSVNPPIFESVRGSRRNRSRFRRSSNSRAKSFSLLVVIRKPTSRCSSGTKSRG